MDPDYNEYRLDGGMGGGVEVAHYIEVGKGLQKLCDILFPEWPYTLTSVKYAILQHHQENHAD